MFPNSTHIQTVGLGTAVIDWNVIRKVQPIVHQSPIQDITHVMG